MKLLVLATDPVSADSVRQALPDEDLDGAEVLVVSPAVNESALAFWFIGLPSPFGEVGWE